MNLPVLVPVVAGGPCARGIPSGRVPIDAPLRCPVTVGRPTEPPEPCQLYRLAAFVLAGCHRSSL